VCVRAAERDVKARFGLRRAFDRMTKLKKTIEPRCRREIPKMEAPQTVRVGGAIPVFSKQACKPNSVSACAATVIPLGDALLRRSSGLPGGLSHLLRSAVRVGPTRSAHVLVETSVCAKSLPIWPCSVWGLPCRLPYDRRGALLPHLFTLTLPLARWAVRFLWHWPYRSLEAATPDVIRHTALRSSDFPLLLHACAWSSSDRPACLL
jgi:hypothetical protein